MGYLGKLNPFMKDMGSLKMQLNTLLSKRDWLYLIDLGNCYSTWQNFFPESTSKRLPLIKKNSRLATYCKNEREILAN